MATGAKAGYKGAILVSSSAGGTVTRIAEIRNWELDVSMSEIDATSHDSSGSREVIAGVDSWTATFDGLHLTNNATHKNTFDALVNKSQVEAEFYPSGSSSDGYWSGACYFNNWRLGSPNEDALAKNGSLVGTGVLARSSSST